jgi:hypothetical protein
MKLFQFRKLSKRTGTQAGYYFKGEFLGRYYFKALQILRERIEDAGSKIGDKSRTNWEKGMEICPDEWQVIHEEYQKGVVRTNKIHEKKKPYYAEIHKRVIARSLITWKSRLEMKERRKQEVMQDYDGAIQEIKDKIKEIEGAIE